MNWEQRYNDALGDIQDEAFAARRKFAPFNSSHEGYAVIAEELDELWDDVKANNVDHAIEEAIQVGAMALRFIADMRAKRCDAVLGAAKRACTRQNGHDGSHATGTGLEWAGR